MEFNNKGWKSIAFAPENKVVMTKIDDRLGVRNVQRLKKIGNLWFYPDGKMYVYYAPTHFLIE